MLHICVCEAPPLRAIDECSGTLGTLPGGDGARGYVCVASLTTGAPIDDGTVLVLYLEGRNYLY